MTDNRPSAIKAIFSGVVLIVSFIVLAAVAVLLAIYLPRLWAGPAGETEKILITNDGAYRIQGYERFYDLQEEIAAVDTKLDGYPEELGPRESIECRGLLAKRANLVADYNSSARAEETTGQWQADDLPRTLPQDNPRSC